MKNGRGGGGGGSCLSNCTLVQIKVIYFTVQFVTGTHIHNFRWWTST